MTGQIWSVRLAERAEADLADIAAWTRREFGPRQADGYVTLLLGSLQVLEHGPNAAGTRDRSDLRPGLRTLRPRRARHIFLFSGETSATGGRIEVLRILHTAMDPTRHLDPA